MVRIIPPLPAPSRPSKMITTRSFLAITQSCSLQSSVCNRLISCFSAGSASGLGGLGGLGLRSALGLGALAIRGKHNTVVTSVTVLGRPWSLVGGRLSGGGGCANGVAVSRAAASAPDPQTPRDAPAPGRQPPTPG